MHNYVIFFQGKAIMSHIYVLCTCNKVVHTCIDVPTGCSGYVINSYKAV